jgi:hypothetical protein
MRQAARPQLAPEVESPWHGYIDQWIAAADMPIFVRTAKTAARSLERGCWIERHGRRIIRCDNSPAQWIFRYGYECPDASFEALRSAFEKREVPVAMVITKAACAHPRFMHFPSLGQMGINHLGWELSHRQCDCKPALGAPPYTNSKRTLDCS